MGISTSSSLTSDFLTPPSSAVQTVQGRIRVALFIRNFRIGGAELNAFGLSEQLDKHKFDVIVIALRGDGELGERFRSLPNLKVVTLKGGGFLSKLFRLISVIRSADVQILHPYLLTTNVYALFAKLFVRRLKVIISLQDSFTDFLLGCTSGVLRSKILLVKWCQVHFSSLADMAISNSEAGKKVYEEDLKVRIEVVSSGIDTDRFRPDPTARESLRDTVGASPSTKLVGILANCTIYKDYPTFIRAAKIVADKIQDVHFVCIGEDRTDIGAGVKNLVQQSGLQAVIHFMGTRRNVPELLPSLDVLCSSSVTEGFSSAIAEAMACAVPCVVTDVGDSRRIVGEAGIVVPPRNPEVLAAGIIAVLSLDDVERGRLAVAARQRIVENFGAAGMALQHERLYESVLASACDR